MEQKTVGIIATIVTVLLCGCPGLTILCFGGLGAVGAFLPDPSVDDPQSALLGGVLMVLVGTFLLVVPIVIGFFTLRARSTPARTQVIDYDEPIPPAI
jgi:UPF0716 family protein affecting phage T7 exclusion